MWWRPGFPCAGPCRLSIPLHPCWSPPSLLCVGSTSNLVVLSISLCSLLNVGHGIYKDLVPLTTPLPSPHWMLITAFSLASLLSNLFPLQSILYEGEVIRFINLFLFGGGTAAYSKYSTATILRCFTVISCPSFAQNQPVISIPPHKIKAKLLEMSWRPLTMLPLSPLCPRA